jgi:sigma-B regulation protein RsbU (phosphoserine phosphatase)
MTQKLMFVDDEPDVESLMRMKFRRQIRENQYELVFARSGSEALQRLGENPDICVVLSDINMPEMDGLTLLQRIVELKNPLLKTVVVSAYGDMGNIRTAMNRGAFDFVTKPIDFVDLETTIKKTLDHIEAAREAIHEHDQLVSVRRDLSLATRIQQSIVPRTFPAFPERKEFDIYAEMVTAREVGGDFYDFFFLDGKRLAIAVGDVSGKGVPAAIFMAMSRTLLKAVAFQLEDPGACLTKVNELLISENKESMFVTVFYGILDTETGELRYSNGGHNSPCVVKAAGRTSFLESVGGPFVGMIPHLSFKSTATFLEPGNALFAHTDGVTEAFDIEGNLFGEQRMEETLKKATDETPEYIVKSMFVEVNKFTGSRPQADDITMLALRYAGVGA